MPKVVTNLKSKLNMKILENIKAFFSSMTWIGITGYALMLSPALTVMMGKFGFMSFDITTILMALQAAVGALLIVIERYSVGLMKISSSTLWSTVLSAVSIIVVGVNNHTNYLQIVNGVSGLLNIDFYNQINPAFETLKSEVMVIISMLTMNTAINRFKK